MIMTATVISAHAGSLLVRDQVGGNEVKVIYRNARSFSPGDRVKITYGGAMTQSIPPQISATSIQKVFSPVPPKPTPPKPAPPISSEIRAVVLQVKRESLLVRGANNSRMLVHFAQAHHFCPGQRIVIRHDRITLRNPIEVHATDIRPIC